MCLRPYAFGFRRFISLNFGPTISYIRRAPWNRSYAIAYARGLLSFATFITRSSFSSSKFSWPLSPTLVIIIYRVKYRMQGMENSAINLLRTLGCKHIEVEVQPETVFEVEFESCLELQFCWPALLLIWISFHILLLNPDKVAVNIFLAEVVRIAHRLDEIDNVLWVSAPAWTTLHTEPRSPI